MVQMVLRYWHFAADEAIPRTLTVRPGRSVRPRAGCQLLFSACFIELRWMWPNGRAPTGACAG
jgi:hypothetical protein